MQRNSTSSILSSFYQSKKIMRKIVSHHRVNNTSVAGLVPLYAFATSHVCLCCVCACACIYVCSCECMWVCVYVCMQAFRCIVAMAQHCLCLFSVHNQLSMTLACQELFVRFMW